MKNVNSKFQSFQPLSKNQLKNIIGGEDAEQEIAGDCKTKGQSCHQHSDCCARLFCAMIDGKGLQCAG